MNLRKVYLVIGAGAAGFMGAITVARLDASARVIICEKSNKVLAKVRISGGGRCNVTHACFDAADLVKYYPRGNRELRGPFTYFGTRQTLDWFSEAGVEIKSEADGRMFPVSDSSESIIQALLTEAAKAGVEIKLGASISGIKKQEDGTFRVDTLSGGSFYAEKILIASGGSPTDRGYDWLRDLGHTIIPPVPSLFTFNLPGDTITGLMGLSVNPARIKIAGTKFSSTGPLLVTHWGMSGPAVLRLSSEAARHLAGLDYQFQIRVSWLLMEDPEELTAQLQDFRQSLKNKNILPSNPFLLPKRLWEFLLKKIDLDSNLSWANISAAKLKALREVLLNDTYTVSGRTTFKEEFVTCGGVALKEINFKTMESKVIPGIYFAGEVLDIDAVTGGFNFQAAWTSGYIAGKSMVTDMSEK